MRPLVALALALAVLSPARAVPADVAHACVAKSNGKVRIVAVAGMCNTRTETPLDWNQSGLSSGPFKFAGFTTATAGSIGNANAGMLEWTRACRTEFPGSRACRSDEVLFAVDLPQIANPDDFAWVIPQVIANGLDVSGAGFTSSCAAFTNNPTAMGLLVDGHGRYTNASCTEAHRVACCVPP